MTRALALLSVLLLSSAASAQESATLVSTFSAADVVYAYGDEGPTLWVGECEGEGYPRVRVLLIDDQYDSRADYEVREARSRSSADIVLCID